MYRSYDSAPVEEASNMFGHSARSMDSSSASRSSMDFLGNIIYSQRKGYSRTAEHDADVEIPVATVTFSRRGAHDGLGGKVSENPKAIDEDPGSSHQKYSNRVRTQHRGERSPVRNNHIKVAADAWGNLGAKCEPRTLVRV